MAIYEAPLKMHTQADRIHFFCLERKTEKEIFEIGDQKNFKPRSSKKNNASATGLGCKMESAN